MFSLKSLKFLLILKIFLIFIINLCLVSAQGKTTSAAIVCYYSAWAYQRPKPMNYDIENVPAHLCTHIIYSFVGLDNKTYDLKDLDTKYDIDRKGIERFVGLKTKNPKLKVMVAIGGWDEGGKQYSEMVTDKAKRTKFIKEVLDFMNSGIN